MAIPHVWPTHTASAQKAVIIGNFFGLFGPNDLNSVCFPLRQSHEMALQLLPPGGTAFPTSSTSTRRRVPSPSLRERNTTLAFS
jgi:hypothetical protein